jgi:hypothetical protein
LAVNFHLSQYDCNIFSADCIPSFDSENITMSSAYNKTYLGITLKYGSFVDARKRLVEQAQKSLFAIIKKRKNRNQNIPIDLQLKLFDSFVEPIRNLGFPVLSKIDMTTDIHLKS